MCRNTTRRRKIRKGGVTTGSPSLASADCLKKKSSIFIIFQKKSSILLFPEYKDLVMTRIVKKIQLFGWPTFQFSYRDIPWFFWAHKWVWRYDALVQNAVQAWLCRFPSVIKWASASKGSGPMQVDFNFKFDSGTCWPPEWKFWGGGLQRLNG